MNNKGTSFDCCPNCGRRYGEATGWNTSLMRDPSEIRIEAAKIAARVMQTPGFYHSGDDAKDLINFAERILPWLETGVRGD